VSQPRPPVDHAGHQEVPTIQVTCDDPRHGRGKVAHIALFGKQNGRWVLWPWGVGRRRDDPPPLRVVSVDPANRRPFDIFDRSEAEHRADDRGRVSRVEVYVLACPLCPRKVMLRPGRADVDEFLDARISAARRVVTLSELEDAVL